MVSAPITSTKQRELTFQVEKHIGLVVLEHLRHQFHVHVLDIDLLSRRQSVHHHHHHHDKTNLKALVHDHDGFIEFFLMVPLAQMPPLPGRGISTYHVGDNTRQQHRLLVLVGTLLGKSE
jgi:hypothetical protein